MKHHSSSASGRSPKRSKSPARSALEQAHGTGLLARARRRSATRGAGERRSPRPRDSSADTKTIAGGGERRLPTKAPCRKVMGMPGQCSQAARYVASGLQTRAPPWGAGDSVAMPASRDLPTTLEPSSLTVGEAGDFKCLRDPPQAPCLRRPGLFSFGLHATGYNVIQRLPLGAHASLF